MREGLRAMLECAGRAQVVLQARTAEEVEHQIQKGSRPDVVLLQLVRPVQPLLAAVARLRQGNKAKGVLVMGELTNGVVQLLVEAGACGVLTNAVEGGELHQAVCATAVGGLHANAWLLGRIRGTGRGAAQDLRRHNIALTGREQQVLVAMCHPAGLTLQAIADKLGIGLRTVQSHRDALFEKFEVKTRCALVARAHELRMV